MFSIEIGAGTVISGSLTTIDWSKGPYFIHTETDPTGGTDYTITGTSELLSVPYALHAQTAESITGEITVTETDPLFIASVASSITATDTAKWSRSTPETGAQLDSAGIARWVMWQDLVPILPSWPHWHHQPLQVPYQVLTRQW